MTSSILAASSGDSADPVIRIYVCHHKAAISFKDDVFLPIHVGRAISDQKLEMLGDDRGGHISEKNPSFCELTALYWVWKNDSVSEWVGLMHYRRFLSFAPGERQADVHGLVSLETLDAQTIDREGLNGSSVKALIKENPSANLFLPKKWSVRNVASKNLLTHYKGAKFHHAKDIEIARDVIKEIFPDQVGVFDRVMTDHWGYFTNIFLLRRDLFDMYCEWLFKILFEVEKRIDISNYCPQSARVFGYLSERLFNVFLQTLPKSDFRPIELPILFISRPDLPKETPPAPEAPPKGAVSVAISSDDSYAPHLAALILSIKENLSSQNFLDCLVLDGGISEANKKFLETLYFENLPGGGRISFIDCSGAFKDVATHSSFATATFYRLLLDKILPNHSKVIYLDCDMIVLRDIAELWNTDLGDNLMAATPDLIMKSFVNTGIKALAECEDIRAKVYLQDYVGLGDKYDDYFQAGVILFNLESLRKTSICEEAILDLKRRVYWFLDQDVLNRHFLGKVCFLDTVWNVPNMGLVTVPSLSARWVDKLQKDIRDPFIIHYAGHEAKPWNNPLAPLAEMDWRYQRRTPWYERVLYQTLASRTAVATHPAPGLLYGFLRSVWRRLPRGLRWRLHGTAMRVISLYK
jgi:lipopolysaccharide biosynthesis glycosyltransferase